MSFEYSSDEAKAIVTNVRKARSKVNEIKKRLKGQLPLKKTIQYDWLVDQERLAEGELNGLEFEMIKMKNQWKKEQG